MVPDLRRLDGRWLIALVIAAVAVVAAAAFGQAEPTHWPDDDALLKKRIEDVRARLGQQEVGVRRPGLDAHFRQLSRQIFDSGSVHFERFVDVVRIIQGSERSHFGKAIHVERMTRALEVTREPGVSDSVTNADAC